MKTILTHLAAFVLGVIALPVIAFVTVSIAPDFIPKLIRSTVDNTGPRDRGVVRLNNTKSEEERFYALGDAAKQSFIDGKYTDGRTYADELAVLTPKYKGNWNYGNAIQDYNVVLGRLAVREGRVEDAKRHLIEAGRSPGSPQMGSFGPNVSLAKDLLEKGERQTVIEYFTLCKSFWEMGQSQLDDWIALVHAGRVPNFGPNLLY